MKMEASMLIFTQKTTVIYRPNEKNFYENFAARAPKIWVGTAKIMPDLWLSAIFCPIKKKLHHKAGEQAGGE